MHCTVLYCRLPMYFLTICLTKRHYEHTLDDDNDEVVVVVVVVVVDDDDDGYKVDDHDYDDDY